MKHLLTILEAKHLRHEKVIWEAFNIPNTFHLSGEEFLLSVAFDSTAGIVVPSFYYLGMDNRSTVNETDNMQSISTEPSGNGYSRQPVSSATGFNIELFTISGDTSGIQHWRAKTNIITFTAAGSQWGPVSNVFLTDRIDNSGYLISTAPLGDTRVVKPGDKLTFSFYTSLVNGD